MIGQCTSQAIPRKIKEEVTMDWLSPSINQQYSQQKMLKMIAIADDRYFIYDKEIELVQFIASEMEKEALDINNEENLDSYLNIKFMQLH